MKNFITVKMNFSYKGKEFVFESIEEMPLHLDGLLEFSESIPRRLALANEVDTYSYMFDSMECTPIEVIKAEGYVSRFMQGDSVPLERFLADCNEVTVEMLMQHIAENYMIHHEYDDDLKQALMVAYEIGRSAGSAH
jgi:hypothetical protein